jgi:hypothetical protein
MTEFVEKDTGKDKDDEKHAVTRCGKPSALPGADSDPNEERKNVTWTRTTVPQRRPIVSDQDTAFAPA